MANTYSLIEAKTLSSDTASISFTSIPATFTDLLVFISSRTNAGITSDEARITFNNNTSSYSWKMLYSSGSGAFGANDASDPEIPGIQMPGNNATASTFSVNSIYIPGYASSNYKSVSIDSTQEDNVTTAYIKMVTGLWSNTAAITSIQVFGATGSFVPYSTFYLYGIKKN